MIGITNRSTLAASLVVITGIMITAGQTVPVTRAQQFDVASIKPCVPGAPSNARGGAAGANFIHTPGSTIINCVVTAHLLNRAYVMYGSQPANDPINAWTGLGGIQFNAPTGEPLKVRGGPAWVYTEKLSIEAKAPGGADTNTMMGPMLRSLLEDRFRVKLHQETEEAPMWTLTVAKGGPKFKPALPGGCIPTEIGRSMQEARAANPGKPFCGRWVESFTPVRSWKLSGVPVRELTAVLTQELDLPVIDRTGLTGEFNFVFEYGPDDNGAGPSVFNAVRDQLGLTLEKARGPRGFLVIDQITRPAPDIAAPAASSGRPGLAAAGPVERRRGVTRGGGR